VAFLFCQLIETLFILICSVDVNPTLFLPLSFALHLHAIANVPKDVAALSAHSCYHMLAPLPF
jgi:hypothetical protein